ncbi:kinase-like domain-containing protein [Mycena maculata]|uniref:Kinase-like domain-containing protein n=1 Tax=Mycena maculata TaxID=230809 RepID=A0AAD7JFP0_9AGAR|nr:kinase-like domain-containing protein [Mycena maculata]
MATPDYSLIPDLHAYLAARPGFESERVEPLSGGTGNFVFRLYLKTPFEGRASLVLKHTKNYIASAPSVPFAIERQLFEAEALRRVGGWLPADSPVRVPTVHLFDEENHILIMDDCGPAAATLKTLMLAGRITPVLADEIGSALGAFLSALHAWSTQPENRAGVALFDGNTQAKGMSAWATYGRLVSTLSGADGLPKLVGLQVSDEDMAVVSQIATEMSRAMNAAETASSPLVMGDFWPGNIMVNLDADGTLQRIDVLDWELVKPGLAGLDIGQFCGEMHQTRKCYPQYAEAATRTVEALLATYARGSGGDAAIAKDALVHCGVHLVVWTPRTPWADEERTKEVVREGLGFLVGGFVGTADALKTSWVAPLVGTP